MLLVDNVGTVCVCVCVGSCMYTHKQLFIGLVTVIHFKDNFTFKAKLGLNFHTPFLPYPCINFTTVNIPQQCSKCVIINESTLITHCILKFTVCISVHFLCCAFHGFGQMELPAVGPHRKWFHCS